MLAIILTLLFYLFLLITYYGWGRVIFSFFDLVDENIEHISLAVWIGWATTLFLFQLIHLFLPIRASTTSPVFILGFFFAFIYSAPKHFASSLYKTPFKSIVKYLFTIKTSIVWISVLALACLIAATSMHTPTNGDSGLYHFNAVRWINTYKIIPGLGNLHGRLAFNQSFFTYVASLNFTPYFGQGRSLANSFLLFLFILYLVPKINLFIRNPSQLFKSHPFRYISDIFMLPLVILLILSSNGLNSPSPDLTSTILQLILFSVLVHGIGEWIEGKKNQNVRAVFLVIIATTAITIKLSNLMFSFSIMCFVFAYIWKTSSNKYRNLLIIFLPAVMISILWMLRSIILSGAPLYPSTIGYISVDWAVPIDKIIDEANWVKSWARQPHSHWKEVLGNWHWVSGWIFRTFISIEGACLVLFPLFMSMSLFIITLIIQHKKKLKRPQLLELSVLIHLFAGIIYWFLIAPADRFAHALFYLLSIESIFFFFLTVKQIFNIKKMSIALITLLFIVTLPSFGFGIIKMMLFKKTTFEEQINLSAILPEKLISMSLKRINDKLKTSNFYGWKISDYLNGWKAVKIVQMETKTTNSGLCVYISPEGQSCWDSPLPSTPYFNASLRLRIPDDIKGGFTVK